MRAAVKQENRPSYGAKVLRTERNYGALSRSVQLLVDIDTAQARAQYEGGVLTRRLPKKWGTTASA